MLNSEQEASSRRSWPNYRWLLVLAFSLSIAYVTREHTLPRIGSWLNVGEDPQSSDYVMLLNGDHETRPFAVADLYRQGKADKILITSVKETQRSSSKPREHQVTRAILTHCGVADSDIEFIDSECGTTFDEALTLKRFLREHPDATVSVVTNEYHTRRSRWTFGNVLGVEMSQVRFVSAKNDWFDSTNWWKHEDGFVWYMSEFFKFPFYWIRYGSGLVWIAAIGGLLGLGFWLRHWRPASVAGLTS